mmetsp:Transcript_5161/g.12413  ORF Transcript_5161/g.12413 Transcript_5161/m.12413 type:complete len:244 (+) Transcript_5161:219-950(+)|eukprot:CAMPEP_0173439278 /NCGR_PEP_ID=MMETSP1357-20121228/20865_1 /TAXON_ID=77926 /ORGANISM="Hemiselmis rufescens, Strain PCC563" /LENGTH=243 /DNA_ID=CAMNT_0014404633 /DNA_START=206 /DNA_END=937 /DNA_ORIENTATION=+
MTGEGAKSTSIDLPKTRGHRGEMLGAALYDMGSSVASALGATSPSHAAEPAHGEVVSPKESFGGVDPLKHHHGSVRGSALSAAIPALLARTASMPSAFGRGLQHMVGSLSELKTSHADGRKLSQLEEGRRVHSGHLKFHAKKNQSWTDQWCVLGDDCTLYICHDEGQESVCCLPLGGGVVIDVSEKEMAHPLCIEVEFNLDGGATPVGSKARTESIVLRAENINDKRAWVRALQHATQPRQLG